MIPVYDRPMAGTPISAFILSGGRSSRMGTDKAFLSVRGQTLLSRALTVARSLTSNVHIVGDPGKFGPFAPVVQDVFPGCGPLAGIHAALRSSSAELNLIIAVDLPLVSPELLHYLTRSAAEAATAMVTVPRTAEGWQPLCAVYRPSFADLAEHALRSGHYKIDALFDPAITHVITDAELRAGGFPATVFRNLNTPQELDDSNQ